MTQPQPNALVGFTLHQGDCMGVLAGFAPDSIDAIVTDPPYGINFMGNAWDGAAIEQAASMHAGTYDLSPTANRKFQDWTEAWAREAYRVLKPGGHMLVFGGTRTYHRLAAGIEDAGFEIRDCVAWMYGSGFPKSLDVSKAIDAKLGATRPDRITSDYGSNAVYDATKVPIHKGTPVTSEAQQWEGWGTALKPAFEPVVMARKPLGGTVAGNVLEHGTGAINVDGCRVGFEGGTRAGPGKDHWRPAGTGLPPSVGAAEPLDAGRWPSNVLLDEEAATALDTQEQGASRFYYVAKPSQAERNAGLAAFGKEATPNYMGSGDARLDGKPLAQAANIHPTVKPIDVMRHLIRLITPPGGTVLDPFTGSGTTGCAATLEHTNFIGIERETNYINIAQARIAFWAEHGEQGLDLVRRQDRADKERDERAAAGQLSLEMT